MYETMFFLIFQKTDVGISRWKFSGVSDFMDVHCASLSPRQNSEPTYCVHLPQDADSNRNKHPVSVINILLPHPTE